MTRLIISIILILSAIHPALAERWAIVSIPVACIRAKAGHGSELVSQAVLGTPLRVISHSGGWLDIETPDGYRGMMRDNSAKLLSQEDFDFWRSSDRMYCTAGVQRLLSGDGTEAAGYATFGSVLNADDPRTATGCVPLNEWAAQAFDTASASKVIETAYGMLGAPYLWGGTSTLAPDCSGFTQTVFLAAGMILPRDAYMQAEAGSPVASLKEAAPGDLIFFGSRGKIDHVALYLGDGRIIHSSGSVRVCRLGNSYPGNDDIYNDKPVAIRRFLGVGRPQGVKLLHEHPFYFLEQENK